MNINRKICSLCLLALIIFSACKENKTERYLREAQEITKQCPILLHQNLQMDSMTYAKSNHEFVYYYTLRTTDFLEGVETAGIRNELLEQIINSPEMLPYIEDSISLRYVYRILHSNDVILDFVFRPEELQHRKR